MTSTQCPKCKSENTYQDGMMWMCPECGGDGHDIACKIDGIGAINLKSEFVRKA